MALQPARVVIRNFRSIRSLDIDLKPSCLVLLGVNESGKSNILRALATLSPATRILDDDVRQLPSEEDLGDEASIEFSFPADDGDRQNISARLNALVLSGSKQDAFSLDGEFMAVEGLLEKTLKEFLYFVDVAKKRRYGRIWQLPRALEVGSGWLVANKACPVKHEFHHPTHGQIRPHEYWLINHTEIPDGEPPEHYRPATLEDVESRLSAVCRAYVEERLPECVWWSFSNDEALPASVTLETFLADESSCLALSNMFRIAGISDVRAAMANARRRSNGVRTLLERVGARTTEYVRSVWSDFASLSLELHENGTLLECVIRDVHGTYNFQRRSDGFRRFVGFLLQVAARAKSGSLRDCVLLYDEPDTSLHPSGATQLRDELLRLAAKNLVVYSTHSIFMVDAACIDRHLIVRRSEETTTVRRAVPSNVADEEVLYNAIGHSLYSVLRARNVVVEGHKDRVLLACAVASDCELAQAYADVGICHAGGVRNVSKITPMLQLAGRECLVVSDGDKAATDSRKEYAGHATWVTYPELVGEGFVTAEDFLDPGHVARVLERLASGPVPELAPFVRSPAVAGPGLMKQILQAFGASQLDKARRSEAVALVKEALFEQLTPDSLLPEAVQLARSILDAASRRQATA